MRLLAIDPRSLTPWLLRRSACSPPGRRRALGFVSTRFCRRPATCWPPAGASASPANCGPTSRSASPGPPPAFSSAAASASPSASPTACPRISERCTDATLQMVRNMPHLALIPLVILWFGIEEEAQALPRRARRVLPRLRQHAPRHPLRRSAAHRDGPRSTACRPGPCSGG